MATRAKKRAKRVRLRSVLNGGRDVKARIVYKFDKYGRNCGLVLEHEKRDRTLYDYSDEM